VKEHRPGPPDEEGHGVVQAGRQCRPQEPGAGPNFGRQPARGRFVSHRQGRVCFTGAALGVIIVAAPGTGRRSDRKADSIGTDRTTFLPGDS
jgi:hypothetical protein